MDFFFYFSGTCIEGFGATNAACAKRYIQKRYGKCGGVIAPVAANQSVQESAMKRSKELDSADNHKLEVMQ